MVDNLELEPLKEKNRHLSTPREPKVENKYNLLLSDIEMLKINDNSRFNQAPFMKANGFYYIKGSTKKDAKDEDYSEYLIKFYDTNSISNHQISVECFCDGGLGRFFFERFYKKITSYPDLEMQELLLSCVNWLLDEKILVIPPGFVSGKNQKVF